MRKAIAVLLLIVAATCSAGVRDELAKTKTESIRSWSGIRDAILAIGPSTTNELARAAADEGLDWRERFMANVCLERLVNGQRRDDFFRNPFRGDPERDLSWIVMATGYAREEIPLVEKRLSENGFWFGVLEAFAHMDTDPCAFDSVFKAAFSIVDESAPLYIRKTAAQISEEFARRFVDGIDEYAGTYVTALKRYILDGTHVGGVATYLRFLASQKHCSFVELEDMVALTSDIALLESLIPCFSSRPEYVSMIQRRIEHLRESMVVDEDPQPAPVLDSGLAEREEVSAPVGEEVVGTSPDSNDGTHSRPSWLFAGGVVLFVIVLAILVRFRRLFPDSVGHRRNLVLFAGFALSLTCATTGSAGVMDELARTRMEPIRSWSGIRDSILAIGSSTTNELARVAGDESLDWRERFMANVCLEHLQSPTERNAFFDNPLKDDPERNPTWIITAAGFAFEEIPLFKRRLCETNFWYSALEVFAMMEDEQMLHPLWKLVDGFIFENAPGDIRTFAAQIAETCAREYYEGVNPWASSYVDWLERYVADGTHPAGSALVLSHLDSKTHFDPTELRAILGQTADVGLLETVASRFADSHSWKRILVEERIKAIKSETNASARMLGVSSPGERSEDDGSSARKSNQTPHKRLPPGVLFRGNHTAPDFSPSN